MTKTGDQSRANLAELRSLEERCSLLEMKMGMFWRLVEEHLSGMLKKPIHLEMDMLLEKLKNHTLTLSEARTLQAQLQKTYLDAEAVHAHEKLVAILVMSAVEALIRELERKPCG